MFKTRVKKYYDILIDLYIGFCYINKNYTSSEYKS